MGGILKNVTVATFILTKGGTAPTINWKRGSLGMLQLISPHPIEVLLYVFIIFLVSSATGKYRLCFQLW